MIKPRVATGCVGMLRATAPRDTDVVLHNAADTVHVIIVLHNAANTVQQRAIDARGVMRLQRRRW